MNTTDNPTPDLIQAVFRVHGIGQSIEDEELTQELVEKHLIDEKSIAAVKKLFTEQLQPFKKACNKARAYSLDALKAACKELGLEFVEGQKTYRWFGRWVQDYHAADAAYKQGFDPKQYGKCDHVIKVPDAGYDIGVVKQPNGKYKMIYDFFGPGRKIVTTLGKGCEKLVQYYGLNRSAMVARAKGLIVQRKTTNVTRKVEGLGLNPDIKLVVTGIK